MEKISTIGLDIAKRVFQIHAVDNEGQVVEKKQVQRSRLLDWFSKTEPCLVGIRIIGAGKWRKWRKFYEKERQT